VKNLGVNRGGPGPTSRREAVELLYNLETTFRDPNEPAVEYVKRRTMTASCEQLG